MGGGSRKGRTDSGAWEPSPCTASHGSRVWEEATRAPALEVAVADTAPWTAHEVARQQGESAKLAEQAGAPAIFVSGFAASAIITGKADIGILTQTEMFEHIRRICRVSTVPVFADADTGYGGILDVQRTMALWEEAGASCLHIEDQALPKKCGHFAGKQLITKREMQLKLRAMLDARRDLVGAGRVGGLGGGLLFAGAAAAPQDERAEQDAGECESLHAVSPLAVVRNIREP